MVILSEYIAHMCREKIISSRRFFYIFRNPKADTNVKVGDAKRILVNQFID